MPVSCRIGDRPLSAHERPRGVDTRAAARRVRLWSACGSWLLGTCWLLTACSRPEPPDKERPPEPQAAARAPARHTGLRDAIQAPQDKARAVEAAVDDAAKAQRSAIEAAGG